MGALRGLHFAATSAAGSSDAALALLWALTLGVIAWSLFVVATDRRLALPAVVDRVLEGISERTTRVGRRLALLLDGDAEDGLALEG